MYVVCMRLCACVRGCLCLSSNTDSRRSVNCQRATVRVSISAETRTRVKRNCTLTQSAAARCWGGFGEDRYDANNFNFVQRLIIRWKTIKLCAHSCQGESSGRRERRVSCGSPTRSGVLHAPPVQGPSRAVEQLHGSEVLRN